MGTRMNQALWFAAIWFGSVVTIGIVAYAIRLILKG